MNDDRQVLIAGSLTAEQRSDIASAAMDYYSSEPTLELDPEDDDFPFVESAEEKLRCFIVREMASSDIDGTIMVQNMDKVFKWVTSGKVPRMTYVKGKAVEVSE